MIDKNLPERLKELRSAYGYKQDDIADILNVSRQNYSHYETGRNVPPTDVLVKICEVYHISLDELLNIQYKDITYSKDSRQLSFTFESKDANEFINFIEKGDNKKRFQNLTIEEKDVLFLFKRLNKRNRQEILEIMCIKYKYE